MVRGKNKVLYTGQAKNISSINELGAFDILPRHKSFISLIKTSLEIRKREAKTMVIPLETGILRVDQNQVEIYLFKTQFAQK